MNRQTLFNIGFTFIFFVSFSLILYIYVDDFAKALTKNDLFPKDEHFDIQDCQRWTDDIRQFTVSDQTKAEQVTVLMYHRVIDDKDIEDFHLNKNGSLKSTILLKSEFQQQMELLQQENVTTLTAKELELFVKNKLDVPKNSVVLTFDDGYKDNAVEVYPILKQYDFNAISFLITAAIDKYDQDYQSEEHQYFSVNDLQNSCDVFDFQSHTYNFHKRMEDHTPYLIGKDSQDVKQDIATSLINLNGSSHAFASPYGAYNPENIELFKELGFEMAFTVEPADVYPGTSVYEIPRKEVYPDETLEDFKQKINLD